MHARPRRLGPGHRPAVGRAGLAGSRQGRGRGRGRVAAGVAGGAVGGHARTGTAQAAFAAGASHVVVGRSVTRAADPVAVLERVRAVG
ncbi:orotidine 5'-phosphate decarboxylase / HUMPS family protein [Streptomyces sp. ISL-86]|uniref:orotidine 5'-phosphate decarboxylase / HUMPS family protein n=1 Tax=unclassified Streptomyces TaxID=2593676 RepID=UPI0035A94B4A